MGSEQSSQFITRRHDATEDNDTMMQMKAKRSEMRSESNEARRNAHLQSEMENWKKMKDEMKRRNELW